VTLKKKLINVQHIKLGSLTLTKPIVLLLAIILITVDPSQSSVFAQNSTSTLNSVPITPSPETSDDDSSSIDNYVQKLISDATQDDASSSEEDVDETEDTKTNPLSEQIRKRVVEPLNGTLTQ
jgi:hypothetical protein